MMLGLRFLAYITSVLCSRLLFQINYAEKISIIIKYRFPARMYFESLRMRVKSTRIMVQLQCHAVCRIATHAGDSFSNGRRHVPTA
jgi:hypothetical protein